MNIEPYQSEDQAAVQEMLAQLQDYISQMDFMQQIRPYNDFDAAAYFEERMASVNEKQGKALVAKQDGKVVGCILGWIRPASPFAELENYPNTTGYVSDLFVDEAYRSQGVGHLLMQAMEAHFKEEGCDNVRVTVFAPNQKAYPFYEREGYEPYSTSMTKKL